jgi:CPA2 family monovalent cation:H+ antiporter-2
VHSLTFLGDLAVVMIVAGVVTVIFHRIRQPVVLGYILAGVIIGPHTPPFPLITDRQAIDTLAELGIIFMMFSLGLEFNLRKVRRVGATALVAAVFEIILMLWLGYEIGRMFGWSEIDSLFLGAMISISSTTIILKALEEMDLLKELSSQLMFGILIIEDILAIAMIALLTGIAMTGALDPGEAVLTIGRLVVFLTALFVVGLLTVPRTLAGIARFGRNEVLLIAVLALCFGVSLLTARMGYSVALGAFAIGAIMAESRELVRVQHLTEPIRDMFGAVFFVAIGLLIEPRLLVEHAGLIVVVTLVVVGGKVAACALGTFLTGHDLRTALRVGMGLAQIGEFSFIIAALGSSLKVTSPILYPVAVSVSGVTTLLTPYLIRHSDAVAGALFAVAPRPLIGYLELYGERVRALGRRQGEAGGRALIHRIAWRLTVATGMLVGIFVATRLAAERHPEWFGGLPVRPEIGAVLVWLVALVISMPVIVVANRALAALGELVARNRVSPEAAGDQTPAVRSIVEKTVVLSGNLALGLLIAFLSATMLAPGQLFILIVLGSAALAILLWRPGLRLFDRTRRTLEAILAETPALPVGSPLGLAGRLGEARLETVVLGDRSAAVGQRIRELQIRSLTGASVVGIERGGANLVNPSPEEEFRAGDRVLLLGEPVHLERARALLTRERAASGVRPGGARRRR